MKEITVNSENWFKIASWHDVKMLALKYLAVPAANLDSKQSERFKRQLVKQVYMKSHAFGEKFDVMPVANPFGKVPKRRVATSDGLTGQYAWIKNGLRAPEDDVRWKMMECLEAHSTFEEATAAWEKEYGKGTKFKSTGKLEFTFKGQAEWAIKRNWIERI